MMLRNEISSRLHDFKSLCDQHQVKYIYAFGSSVTDRFDANSSDIDLLLELEAKDPLDRGEKLISLWDSFEDFFSRRVDLLTENSVRNPYLRKSIDSTKVLIYDGAGKKVLI